ncbi:DMT family transporter [Mucilaginibacter phyllosphaerae]|uniref:Drug/metabolite transporter (DMT)-like permease n=1 Tax=Mucilaginibacter phyllosphaerae TaxID=1812349 RepID=A0A4Y8A8C1_9SPHI|nr:EamA family transporter [Mucilaginibacter phyllosphaerae]MBB3970635.1 drug/metabolite transporter (DMT)-like permease [Mucilaginibacter phyllosphaerae]TEW64642.1 EamA family transporter [Mucilaginibacter phyllosphaerae]GGH19975.1 permease [Mucilaginibacter phyllosphaerae]
MAQTGAKSNTDTTISGINKGDLEPLKDVSGAKNGLNKNLIILHFTVFVWGFTGILGQLISISAVNLVWYRVLIASLSLFLYFKFNKTAFKVSRNTMLKLVFTGALVGGHWVLFFASIKLSTVPVTLVCLSSITLFTAIFEPVINKKPISKMEIVAGIFIIIGIILIFKFETQYTKGIIAGLISAILASLFAIINGRQVKHHEAPVIAFYELSGAFVWITLYLFVTGGTSNFIIPKATDLGYLFLLGTVCTSLAYVAGVSVMRELSAFRVALITNLEPVYGIMMAFLFFGDMNKMSAGFWVGSVIILSTIFLFPVAQKQVAKRRNR